jgi:hypothetical protein
VNAQKGILHVLGCRPLYGTTKCAREGKLGASTERSCCIVLLYLSLSSESSLLGMWLAAGLVWGGGAFEFEVKCRLV